MFTLCGTLKYRVNSPCSGCAIPPLLPHQQVFNPLSHWQLQPDKMRLFRVAPSLAQAEMKLGKASN